MGSPPLLHQAEYRVRFDEAGPDGHLRPSGYLRFAQDLAWRHSETAGYDRAWYRDRGVHWLVHSVVLEEALVAGRAPDLPRTWHIEHVLPALPDQALTSDLWRWGDGWAWRLRGDAAAAVADDPGVGGTDGGAGRELCRAVVRPKA